MDDRVKCYRTETINSCEVQKIMEKRKNKYGKLIENFTKAVKCLFNPFTPTGDQDRISPYNMNVISSRQVIRIEKNINHEIIS